MQYSNETRWETIYSQQILVFEAILVNKELETNSAIFIYEKPVFSNLTEKVMNRNREIPE